jgi:Flp pilus assembly protein TadG
MRAVRSGPWPRILRFFRDEQGGMTIFALLLFVCMLIVGGMAVDMMRHETQRVRLQATLDRCALAAADLDQTVIPETVVRDCFRKAGLERQLATIDVERTARSSRVRVTAGVIVPTFFMRLAGVTELTAPAAATAEEAVSNVEVSLVLDISGSMRYDRFGRENTAESRITLLRPAARNFVTQVLNGSVGTSASINLVPYAGGTNPGVSMFNYLNGERIPGPRGRIVPPGQVRNVSSCLEIPGSAFGQTGLPPRGLRQMPHFHHWAINATVMDWGWCPEDDTSIIYASGSEAALHAAINGIRMHDGTGTHFGMKWGLALLDPSSNAAFRHLNSLGEVPDAFLDRPRAWADPDTQKFVVLMTDGAITEQVRPKNRTDARNNDQVLVNRGGDRENITSASDNVASFYASCDAAKANGVIVFTISFEAEDPAPEQMRRCASSPGHFFDVRGSEIADAFREIENQINALRLTR